MQALAQGYTGLIGLWTFDGNANDVSGNGLNGIPHNVTPTTGMNGLPNTAYQFNGTSSYINVPYNSLMNTKIHSFCALIKPTGFYSGNCQGNAIIWRGRDISSTFSYQLEMFDNAYDNSDAVYSPDHEVFAGWTGHTTGNTPQVEWYYTPTTVLNTWYSVVLTYDGDSTKIYVDNALMSTFYNPSNFTNTTDSMTFGWAQTGFPYWLNATVDEIRFYNRVLSPTEVAMFGDSLGTGKILPIKFYLDANANCVKENSEQYNMLPVTVQVDSNNIPIDTVSATGILYYHAKGEAGDVYSFKVISSATNVFVSCPATGVLIDTLVTGINATRYMGFSCTPYVAFDLDAQLGASTDVNVQVLSLLVNNKYCNPENATVTLNFSPKYAFESALPAPATVSGNTITWNLNALSYLNSPSNIHVTLRTPGSPLTEGDTVITKCTVTPTTGDVNPSDNIVIHNDTIKACHDPNEMSVTPNGCISTNLVTPLQYTIQFENTGNAPAHNIFIMDTLSDKLNIRSLGIVAASHQMAVSTWYDNTYHNIYKFEFPNIELLDSSHHNECKGMVIFNINTVSGIPDGVSIFNHAGIFFDNNPVVMTDTVENIGCANLLVPVFSNSPRVHVFPNPVSAELTVSSAELIKELAIFDLLGREVYRHDFNSENVNVDVTHLPKGLYIIKVNGTQVDKFSRQ